MKESTSPVANLYWSLWVCCPKCDANNDISGDSHDPDWEIAHAIFENRWEKLEGRKITCEYCGHEFSIARVES